MWDCDDQNERLKFLANIRACVCARVGKNRSKTTIWIVTAHITFLYSFRRPLTCSISIVNTEILYVDLLTSSASTHTMGAALSTIGGLSTTGAALFTTGGLSTMGAALFTTGGLSTTGAALSTIGSLSTMGAALSTTGSLSTTAQPCPRLAACLHYRCSLSAALRVGRSCLGILQHQWRELLQRQCVYCADTSVDNCVLWDA